ncbi:hypothetical protein SAMN04489752_1879 [Brevibacterium siliguriense]|uniref:Uncharacterized protein n=1 Tax=Brevibacterium siliguriense TaxID=1136497 RepID=A0A1H1SUM7_9MICO|nr:hypothetical protein SAMN04489752_1879 [Brevibacterium siliguriense]
MSVNFESESEAEAALQYHQVRNIVDSLENLRKTPEFTDPLA